MTRADLVSDVDLWQYAARRAGEKFCGDQVGPARPAWQEDNSEELAQLALQKQQAYRRSRSDPTTIPLYKALVHTHKHRVRQILNEWWANKAAEIQAEVDTTSPNYQYAGYRQLRKVFVMPKRPVSKLRGPNAEFLQTRVARVQRWETYFQDLLNVPSHVSPDLTSHLAAFPPCDTLGLTPTFSEFLAAVNHLKPGKAHGPDGIQPELISALSMPNQRVLYELFCRIWDGLDPMPPSWKANYLVPLPKSGDVTLCTRWRGILLSSVPGKVFSRIISGRLQEYLENHHILPETQCGFRSGRGTTGMIFALRMIMEIARVKQHPVYVLFVDLAKAYDSVHREALCKVLERKGVPARLIALTREFYTGKEARVSVEGTLSNSFSLNTGLGQGCCLAPTLFNIFLAAVMED